MDFKYLKIEDVRTGIKILKISRQESLNALNREVINELTVFFETTMNDYSIRCIILTGEGDKAFVAGADIKEMVHLDIAGSVEFAKLGQRLLLTMYNYNAPIVAAVNGYALGGGFEMALCCDTIFASKNAKFAFPEVSLGIIPGFGGTQILRRLIGEKNAKYIILSGEMISAEDAYRLNIVSRLYDNQADLINGAIAYAEKVAKNSPKSVELAKKAVNVSFDLSLERGLEYESSLFGVLFTTEDQKEGMKAFVEKRKADFKGN